MLNFLQGINSLDFYYFLWAVPLVQLIHELEEWNILKWYKKNFIDLPDISNIRFRIWILFFGLFQYVFVSICFFIPDRLIQAIMISILVMINTLNGFQHIYWQIISKGYAPGTITFVCLMLPLNVHITYRLIHDDFLPFWIEIIIMSVIIPGFFATVKAGNRMTAFVKFFVHVFPGKLLKILND